MSTRSLGKIYEKRAKSFLKAKGYEIIEQNWQCGKIGEIDFIVKDSKRFQEEYIVFIEVKYRKESISSAMLAVNLKKQIQLRKLAQLYLKSKKLEEVKTNISYDVIAISQNEIEHVQNIFNI